VKLQRGLREFIELLNSHAVESARLNQEQELRRGGHFAPGMGPRGRVRKVIGMPIKLAGSPGLGRIEF
jgi:hypothetical protein